MQFHLYLVFRKLHYLGNLPVTHFLYLPKMQHGTLPERQLPDELSDQLFTLTLLEVGVGHPCIGNFCGTVLILAALVAYLRTPETVDGHVAGCRPAESLGFLTVLPVVLLAPSLHQRFLHDILRFLAVHRHAQGQPVELVLQGQNMFAETYFLHALYK